MYLSVKGCVSLRMCQLTDVSLKQKKLKLDTMNMCRYICKSNFLIKIENLRASEDFLLYFMVFPLVFC